MCVGALSISYTKDIFELDRAEEMLNKDHYGLEDVKARVLEFIAVGNLLGHTPHVRGAPQRIATPRSPTQNVCAG